MRNWLKGNVVVLTGASSGIGRQLCKLLILRYGAKVVGVGRNEEKMRSLETELGDYKQNFSYSLFDVSDEKAWQAFADDLKTKSLSPVLLINNAGAFPTFQRALNVATETTEYIMRVNYFSAVYGVNAVAPIMSGVDKKKPYIVNICSSASLCSVAGTGAYTASKGALKGYTETLALDEKSRLHVGLVCPGVTGTELFSNDENTKNSALEKIATSPEKTSRRSGLGREINELYCKNYARKRTLSYSLGNEKIPLKSIYQRFYRQKIKESAHGNDMHPKSLSNFWGAYYRRGYVFI